MFIHPLHIHIINAKVTRLFVCVFLFVSFSRISGFTDLDKLGTRVDDVLEKDVSCFSFLEYLCSLGLLFSGNSLSYIITFCIK